MGEKLLMKGNEAIGEAAIVAGCRHYFGYPITPQTELPEYLARRMPEVGGVFLQAESEIAAINMVYGAAAAGVRTMTSSSSPGMSLKQEGISYIAAAELPCVLVNIQRGGPGLGSIQPGQSDYYQSTRGGGHGDYFHIVLAPNSVQELFDFTIQAFDLADQYLSPVMILGDGALGQMMEPVEITQPALQLVEKPWAVSGMKDRQKPNVITSLHLVSEELEKHNHHLQKKYAEIRANEMKCEEIGVEDADLILVAYGITSRIAKSAMNMARAAGYKVGMLRPITLWPFPAPNFVKAAQTAKAFLTLELSAGQMVDDVRLATNCARPVHFYGRTGGMIPDSHEILAQIITIMQGLEAK